MKVLSREFTLRFFYGLLCAGCLWALFSANAFGQTAARPSRGAHPGGSYQVSDIENINLTTGNLSLSIPLASLPPIAGGKLSFTLNANYNSKLWDVTRSQVWQNEPPVYNYVVDNLQLSQSGGWSVSGGYYILFRESREDFDWRFHQTDPDYNYLVQHPFWHKRFLVTPDGAEHELKPLGHNPYSGGRSHLWGYYEDYPDVVGQPISYYTIDGTYLWVKIYPSNHVSGIAAEIFARDGTVVRFQGGIQRIIDTNGNEIRIWSDIDPTGVAWTHYADHQTGREIKINSPSPGTTSIWYQTVGGDWMHTDIIWGSTFVQGQTYMTRVPKDLGGDCENLTLLSGVTVDVIREIVFPQTEPGQPGRRFTFSYNSDNTESVNLAWWPSCEVSQPITTASRGWGELKRMVMPSGAIVNYTYGLDTTHELWSPDAIARQSITSKTITHDGVTDTWAYAGTAASLTNPDGSFITEMAYPQDVAYPSTWGGPSGLAGLVYRTIQSNKVMIERRWARQVFSGALDNYTGIGKEVFNPVVVAEYTSLLDDSPSHNPVKMSAKTYQYDYNGNLLSQTDYDWFDPALVSRDGAGVPTGVPASAPVLRVVSNNFYNQASDSTSGNVYAKRAISTATPLILNALQQTTSGPAIAQFSYDGNSYGVAPTAGNLTSTSVWHDLDSQWITTGSTYGLYGNTATATDGRGKVTQFFYDDATHALPTRVVVDPQNGTGTQTTTTAFDYYTGLVTSTTDPNGNSSTINYTNQLLGTTDPFGRPGIAYGPLVNVDGVNQRQRVTTTYLDSTRQMIVATDLYAENDKLLKTRTTTDMLGRIILTEQTEGGTTYTITARKVYDPANRMVFSSGPMRSSAAATDSWTRVTSDLLGRPIEVATFAGATQPSTAPANQIAGWTGSVTTSYDANFTTVTDQTNRVRRSSVDALGKLIRVDEPDKDSGQWGSNAEPIQPTCYRYDVLGNLTKVIQGSQIDPVTGICALSGSQQRTFTYDSLSRLRTAVNPESGTISYNYDENGNLISKTDARAIVTNYVYDSLNRVTSRSYQNDPNSTPTVTYTYDTLSPNGKGHLTSVSSSVSSYSYSGYDALGRALGSTQTIDGHSYSVSNVIYDLTGHLKSMTYPSGNVVNYAFDNAGRLNGFAGNLGDGEELRTYANEFEYTALNGLQQEKFGTATPIYHKQRFNSRGQLWDMRASTVSFSADPANGDRGAIVNYYSNNFVQGGNGPDNNGNLLRQEHYIPGPVWSGFFQDNFEYDYLNRLKFIAEKLNGAGNPSFKQTYSYDRYGNRRINTNENDTFGGVNNLDFDLETATNRLYALGDLALAEPSRSMRYDAAGNLWKDTYSGSAVTRLYDAENRMTKETKAGSVDAGIYAYDGDGRRVKRKVNGVETWQVYGMAGELIAEYASNASHLSPQKEYGYRNGELLITATAATAGWGAPPTIDDNPLKNPENPESFKIKAVHITQLRDAINAVRAHYNLPNYQWVKPTASGGAVNITVLISWEPIDEMRTALDEALDPPSPPYTGGLAQGQPILAAHIQELRNRVLDAWQSGGGGVDIRWLVADHLGTPRMIFDQSGSLANVSRHDYLPFGEEVPGNLRTGIPGYGGGGNVRQKFTSYERDTETGLDFARARMFASNHGRFTSPDPFKIVAEVQNEADPERAESTLVRYLMQPQQWNAYAYGLNNPLKYIDPTGEIVELTGSPEEQQTALARIRTMLGEERFALLKQSTVNGKIQLTLDSNDMKKFLAIGNNKDEKALSFGMAGILQDKRIAEFRIAESFQYKDTNGKIQTGYTGTGCVPLVGSVCGGGGYSLPPEGNASGNGNYQIFMHPNAGKEATKAAAGNWSLSGGKGSLVSTNDMIDAHEFGHLSTWMHPSVRDNNPRTRSYPRHDSVIFENAVRSRYPSPLRRVRH